MIIVYIKFVLKCKVKTFSQIDHADSMHNKTLYCASLNKLFVVYKDMYIVSRGTSHY